MDFKVGKILPFLFLSLFSVAIYAQQNEVDSLSSMLQNKDMKDNSKVDLINALAFEYILINPQVAKDDVSIAFNLADKIGYKNGLARAYMVYGGIQLTTGNYADALNNYYKALQYYEKINNQIGVAKTYNNIGEIYKRTGDIHRSLDYHTRALKLKQQHLPKEQTFNSHINIAELYSQMNRLEDAATHYNIVASDSSFSNRNLSYALAGLGQLELLNNNPKKALQFFNKVERLRNESNDQRGLADIYYHKSTAFKQLGGLDSAVYFLKNSISTAKKIGARDILANAYLKLSSVDSLSSNFNDAYLNYVNYSRIKDSILNADKLAQVARIQTEYEIALLQKSNEANEIKMKQQNSLIIAAVMFMLFAIAIAWTFYRQQNNQRKVNYLLASKNLEISRQNDEIQQQSKKLIELNQELEKLNKNLEGKVRERTQKLILQNKKLAEYAYSNAHELRAPVANILGLTNLLAYSPDLSVKEQEIVEHLHKSTNELDKVIRNIRERLEQESENKNSGTAISGLTA